MEKKLKIKSVICVICIIIGIVVYTFSLNAKNISEIQRAYLSGFGTSFTVACLVLLIKNVIALRDPKQLRKREIELTDERNNNIYTKSLAFTFKICLIVQSFLSIILVCLDNMFGIYFGLLVGVELIVFCITNVIFSKRM